MNVPSQAQLNDTLGQTYRLVLPWGESMPVELVRVSSGVPMNTRYCCYAAEFALPAGTQLGQAVYTLAPPAPGGDALSWPLLLTPIGPAEDGPVLMEAVFHYPVPQVQAESAGA
ncbi:hypothetical protein FNU76_11030 [Chitinimonas arctica]|uniref:DUF6916 domain-containing protein n=1 Tax=Chitinimonas arctica TaxID=2594795 RepID=A0A516SFB4_9NEIS|nr:hypothetical protein [Chitinimonas arctica]QDQ26855.1 hypothetical protein FNU76_11030 [Chitinimonas arctica]